MPSSTQSTEPSLSDRVTYAARGLGLGLLCTVMALIGTIAVTKLYSGPLPLTTPQGVLWVPVHNVPLSAFTNPDVMLPLLAAFGVTAVVMSVLSGLFGPELDAHAA